MKDKDNRHYSPELQGFLQKKDKWFTSWGISMMLVLILVAIFLTKEIPVNTLVQARLKLANSEIQNRRSDRAGLATKKGFRMLYGTCTIQLKFSNRMSAGQSVFYKNRKAIIIEQEKTDIKDGWLTYQVRLLTKDTAFLSKNAPPLKVLIGNRTSLFDKIFNQTKRKWNKQH